MQHNLTMEKSQVGWITVTGKTTQGARLIVDEKFGCVDPLPHRAAPGKAQAPRREEGVRGLRDRASSWGRESRARSRSRCRPRHRARTPSPPASSALVIIGAGAYVGYLSDQNKNGLQNDIKGGQLIDNKDSAS